MPKRFPAEIRSIAGELAYSGLDAAEITRRLNQGEAGYPHKVDISERRTREYVEEYERVHGPRPDPDDVDLTSDSFARLKRRITARVGLEVAHYEKRRKGGLKPEELRILQQAFRMLDEFELRTENAEKRRRGKGRKGKEPEKPGKPESVLDRMAREQREASTAPPIPAIEPTEDQGAKAEGDEEQSGTGPTATLGPLMTNAEAEALVAEDKARWFKEDFAAESFVKELGGQYVGEINRVSLYRHLVVKAEGQSTLETTAIHHAQPARPMPPRPDASSVA